MFLLLSLGFVSIKFASRTEKVARMLLQLDTTRYNDGLEHEMEAECTETSQNSSSHS
jgi:hypothetical protein